MLGVRHSSSPIRLRPRLVRPARGCLVLLLLLPVGLSGQETQQVTLYTPDYKTLAPLVIRLRPRLVRSARGCLVLLLLLPVGLSGQETQQVIHTRWLMWGYPARWRPLSRR